MALVKHLRLLVYIAIISLLNSAFDYLPFVPATVSSWVTKGILVATIYCMFRLSSWNSRYNWTAFFRLATLGCSLITSFLFGSYYLNIAIFIFSSNAVYLEYAAHAQLVAEKDLVLSRKWRNLFYWEFFSAIFLSLGSYATALILISSKLQTSASRISSIVIPLLKIPGFVTQLVRLLYLNKMITFFLPDEETAHSTK